MVKLELFAEQSGVTAHHVRRLIREHSADIEGHYEKRGRKGTYLDSAAQTYLRNLLRNPMEIHPAAQKADPEEMQAEINRLYKQNAELAMAVAVSERRLNEYAGQRALLEKSNAKVEELEADKSALNVQNGVLSTERDQARVEAAEAAKAAKEASDELLEANMRINTLINGSWKERRALRKALKEDCR